MRRDGGQDGEGASHVERSWSSGNDPAMSSAGRGERGQRGQPSLGACGELQWVYVGGCNQRSRRGNDGPHTRKKMIPREPARGGAGDARILAEVLSFSEDSGGMASAQALRGSKAVVAGESARSQENARFPALARTPETVASLRRQVAFGRVCHCVDVGAVCLIACACERALL